MCTLSADDSAVVLQDTFVFLTWAWPSKCLMETSLEAEWEQWATWVRNNIADISKGTLTNA